MMDIIELFGEPTTGSADWRSIIRDQQCPYLQARCIKVRKSQPDISIGTCCVAHGRAATPIMICPYRFLERRQVFLDCVHLLALHEPGNELHVVPEISLPGGNVDYFLASVHRGNVVDLVGIELQTMDTTRTVWPARQRFLEAAGAMEAGDERATYRTDSTQRTHRTYGMNWKHTAKTTLIQLHHKIRTLETIGKHLVLVIQDRLLMYLQRTFDFSEVGPARLGDSLHFHAYELLRSGVAHTIELVTRCSTDADGLATCLGLKAEPRVELHEIAEQIERKMSDATRLTV